MNGSSNGHIQRVLITGGAGFVGSTLTQHLIDAGHEVAVLDNLFTGHNPGKRTDLDYYNVDIRNGQRVLDVVDAFRPSVVIHLAAIHYIPYCDAHPNETLQVNVVGTQSVLDACRSVGVKRVIFTSSAAVYGIQTDPHVEDEMPAPDGIYGLTKWFGEQQLAAFHRITGTSSVAVRLFNVYGPGETNPHIIPEIMKQLRAGSTLQLGNISPKRDLIHVHDVARAYHALMRAELPSYFTVNVGSGKATSVQDMVHTIGQILGRDIPIQQDPARMRPVDMPVLEADVTRMANACGWRPEVELESGLSELLERMALPRAVKVGLT
jgi:UDP-glucose 4-epimerase